jgi:hypothetical protein
LGDAFEVQVEIAIPAGVGGGLYLNRALERSGGVG